MQEDVWREVVKAIEDIVPVYDYVNELISLGQAQRARRYAIQELGLQEGLVMLDGGAGPGNASKLVLSETKPKMLVALDESVRQLRVAKTNLRDTDNRSVEFVRGTFEFLPFRDGVFDILVTSYALRDSLDLDKSVSEYCRVCKSEGQLAIVDIGKPDNPVARAGSILYMRFIVPLIAKIAVGGKMNANPWSILFETYVPLPTNRRLLGLVRRRFGDAELREFLMGGIMVILSRRSPSLADLPTMSVNLAASTGNQRTLAKSLRE